MMTNLTWMDRRKENSDLSGQLCALEHHEYMNAESVTCNTSATYKKVRIVLNRYFCAYFLIMLIEST